MSPQKHICIVVADPMTIRAFLSDQIRLLSSTYLVTVVMNSAAEAEWLEAFPNVTFRQVNIVRPVSLIADLRALWNLYLLFQHQRFDLIHSVTPKAGLLAMLAGRLAGVPHRLHTFTGQVWATRQGSTRFVFKSIDRLMARLASTILVDSFSQRDFLEAEGVLRAEQGTVLGDGSISGVDIERFRSEPDERKKVRAELGIPPEGMVFIYLGRLNRDKGILDLAEAYRLYRHSGADGHILLVGPDEGALQPLIVKIADKYHDKLHFVGFTRTPERYMTAADVFCLPSYREGFGSVIIEAASCGIPAIGSRIYGVVDAIDENETGLLHEPGNPRQLSDCMLRLAKDDALRRLMGDRARKRARTCFNKDLLCRELIAFYQKVFDTPSPGGHK